MSKRVKVDEEVEMKIMWVEISSHYSNFVVCTYKKPVYDFLVAKVSSYYKFIDESIASGDRGKRKYYQEALLCLYCFATLHESDKNYRESVATARESIDEETFKLVRVLDKKEDIKMAYLEGLVIKVKG